MFGKYMETTNGYNYANLKVIKLRIFDIFKQIWCTNINNSSKLSSYSLFKLEFEPETYLNRINMNKYRMTLSKLRFSSDTLEKGKW